MRIGIIGAGFIGRAVATLGETSFEYERSIQPWRKLGRWAPELDELLAANAAKSAREQLTLIRMFEKLRGRGYEGGYDAVRRCAKRWSKERGQSTTAAYKPVHFIDDDDIDPTLPNIDQKPLQSGSIGRASREATVIVTCSHIRNGT